MNDPKIPSITEPAKILIKSISGAIGKAYEPRYIKRMADAEAYRIEKLSTAIRNNCDLPIVYNNDSTSIDISNCDDFINRTSKRLAFQELRKQENIENVANMAYNLLNDNEIISSDKSVSPQIISEDWINYFFDSVGNVSEEDMQLIWARILANETVNPNSCSLRTMSVLKHLTINEAKLFQRVSNFVFEEYIISDLTFLEKYDLSYNDILQLSDCGLLNSTNNILSKINIGLERQLIIRNNNYALLGIYSGNGLEAKVNIGVFPLSEAGKTIYQIIEPTSNDKFFFDYCKKIISMNKNVTYSLHQIKNVGGSRIDYDDENQIGIITN